MVKTRSGKNYEERTVIPHKRPKNQIPATSLIDLRIDIKAGENEISLYGNGKKRKFDGNFSKLGPFTINNIFVCKDKDAELASSKIDETLEFFRKQRFSCCKLILDKLPTTFSASILQAVENVASTQVDSTCTEPLSALDVRTLANSRHANTIELSACQTDLHEVPMEILKNLRNIWLSNMKAAVFQRLIETLHTTKDHGNWEKLQFSMRSDEELRGLGKIDIPFPQLYRYFQAGPFPGAVYVQELNSKQLVIVEYFAFRRAAHVFMFVEKGAASLTECILTLFRFDSTSRNFFKAFTEADFEQKGRILSNEVKRNKEEAYKRKRRALYGGL